MAIASNVGLSSKSIREARLLMRLRDAGAVLIAKGDHVLVSSAYGESSYELHAANSPSTRFHIASVSKPFTAAAILLLEQRGMLHVSDPVSRFLPDFRTDTKSRCKTC